jgi:hypothetical protein
MMNAAADVPVLRDISSPFFVSQTLLLISLVERPVETCEFWRFSGPIDIIVDDEQKMATISLSLSRYVIRAWLSWESAVTEIEKWKNTSELSADKKERVKSYHLSAFFLVASWPLFCSENFFGNRSTVEGWILWPILLPVLCVVEGKQDCHIADVYIAQNFFSETEEFTC